MSYMDLVAASETYQQMSNWSSWLWQAGYPTELHATGDEDFPYEWRVFGPGWNGPQVATIDDDGCGASWHGPDELWLRVIAPREDMIA